MIEVGRKPAELRESGTNSDAPKRWVTETCETVSALDQSRHSLKQYLHISKSHLIEIMGSEGIHDSIEDSKTPEHSQSFSNMKQHKASQINLMKYSVGHGAENGINDATTDLPSTVSRQLYEDLKVTNSSFQENLNTTLDSNSLNDKNEIITTKEHTPADTTKEIEIQQSFTDSNEFIEYDDHKRSMPADLYKVCWVELSSVESTVDTMPDPESESNSEKTIDQNELQCVAAVDGSDEDSITKKESPTNDKDTEEIKPEIQNEVAEEKAATSRQPKYSKCFLRLVRALQPDLYEYIENSPEVQQIIKTNKRSLVMTVQPFRKPRSLSQVAKTTRDQGRSKLTEANPSVCIHPV